MDYYRWSSRAALLSHYLYPADRRRAGYVGTILGASLPPDRIRRISVRNTRHRQWMKILTHGWPNWSERWREWANVQGSENLRNALAAGHGAILLSGHSYGFNAFVAPLLGQMGFAMSRTGRGHWDARTRWGRELDQERWEYNAFGGNFWEHAQALNKMRQSRRDNKFIHILVTGNPEGNANLEIAFGYKKFFLDDTTIRIIETLKMPVLPCFATCDDRGRLVIEILPSIGHDRDAIMLGFAREYSRRIREQPEFAFFWRKVVKQQPGW